MNRHKTRITSRFVAIFLACALTLPNPVFALRGQQQEDPSQLAGLEEALKDPAKALRRLAQLVTPAASQTNNRTSFPNGSPGQPYAIERTGLEEQFRTELANQMKASDVLFVDEMTKWAASFGKTQSELFDAMRELGPTLREGKGWRSFLEVVTEEGHSTGQVKVFHAIHRDGDWHRGAAVLFITPDGRFVLQRRDDGRRDLSAGGHV